MQTAFPQAVALLGLANLHPMLGFKHSGHEALMERIEPIGMNNLKTENKELGWSFFPLSIHFWISVEEKM